MIEFNYVTGTRGRQGEMGVPGCDGFKGERGEDGLMGFAGLDGMNGKGGQAGEKGDPGDVLNLSVDKSTLRGDKVFDFQSLKGILSQHKVQLNKTNEVKFWFNILFLFRHFDDHGHHYQEK